MDINEILKSKSTTSIDVMQIKKPQKNGSNSMDINEILKSKSTTIIDQMQAQKARKDSVAEDLPIILKLPITPAPAGGGMFAKLTKV
jgi:hypothetical protein